VCTHNVSISQVTEDKAGSSELKGCRSEEIVDVFLAEKFIYTPEAGLLTGVVQHDTGEGVEQGGKLQHNCNVLTT